MQDLYASIAASNDISENDARRAIGDILAFMRAESDDPAVEEVIAGTPGAADAAASVEPFDAGSGIMALGARLMGLGLDLNQIRAVAGEFVTHAKSHAGAEPTERALASVPAFAQFA